MPTDIAVRTHGDTTRMDLDQIAQNLITHLGPTLVALLANVNDRKLPAKWASKEVRPRQPAETRLRTAHRAWTMVAMSGTDSIARAWFIGANPHLDEISPVEALRLGRNAEVLAAAEQFVDPE